MKLKLIPEQCFWCNLLPVHFSNASVYHARPYITTSSLVRLRKTSILARRIWERKGRKNEKASVLRTLSFRTLSFAPKQLHNMTRNRITHSKTLTWNKILQARQYPRTVSLENITFGRNNFGYSGCVLFIIICWPEHRQELQAQKVSTCLASVCKKGFTWIVLQEFSESLVAHMRGDAQSSNTVSRCTCRSRFPLSYLSCRASTARGVARHAASSKVSCYKGGVAATRASVELHCATMHWTGLNSPPGLRKNFGHAVDQSISPACLRPDLPPDTKLLRKWFPESYFYQSVTPARPRPDLPSDMKLSRQWFPESYFYNFLMAFAPSKSQGKEDIFKALRVKNPNSCTKTLFKNNVSWVIVSVWRFLKHFQVVS